jgi:hypothetical protein
MAQYLLTNKNLTGICEGFRILPFLLVMTFLTTMTD